MRKHWFLSGQAINCVSETKTSTIIVVNVERQYGDNCSSVRIIVSVNSRYLSRAHLDSVLRLKMVAGWGHHGGEQRSSGCIKRALG